MSADILIVSGGKRAMHETYEHYARGYWSDAFSMVLEKRGYLSYEKKSLDCLSDLNKLKQYSLIVVCWFPSGMLRAEHVQVLMQCDSEVLVEGPLENECLQLLHIHARSYTDVDEKLKVIDPVLSTMMQDKHPWHFKKSSLINLSDRKVDTRAMEPDIMRSKHVAGISSNESKVAAAISLSWFVIMSRRVVRGHILSPNYYTHLLNIYVFLVVFRKIEPSIIKEKYLEIVIELLHSFREELNAKKGVLSGEEQHLIDRIKRLACSIEDPSDIDVDYFSEFTGDVQGVMCENILDASDMLIIKNVSGNVDELLEKKIFCNKTLPFIMQIVVFLYVSGKYDIAKRLVLHLRDKLYDSNKNSFKNAKVLNGKLDELPTYCNHPYIVLALSFFFDAIELKHTGFEGMSDYSDKHISSWNDSPLIASKFDGNQQVDELVVYEDGSPAIFRAGNISLMMFNGLSYLTHCHTMGPLLEPFHTSLSLQIRYLEDLFFLIIDRLMIRNEAIAIKVGLWPSGYKYCLSLRHDVDRIPDSDTYNQLEKFHQKKELGVSWFWLPYRLDHDLLCRQKNAGNEIGLHAVNTADKQEELTLLNDSICDSIGISGETLHGSASDYWHGYPTVQNALRQGLIYTEFVPSMNHLPYSSFPYMKENGEINILKGTIGISHNVCTDGDIDTMRRGREVLDERTIKDLAHNGNYICLLNHPDINFDVLGVRLASVPSEGRLNWTESEVAHWWSAAHSVDNFYASDKKIIDGGFRYIICSKFAIANVSIIINGPFTSKSIVIYLNSVEQEYCLVENRRITLSLCIGEESENHLDVKFKVS